MAKTSDILWGMYQENTTQGRHHEEQREKITGFALTAYGGVLALMWLGEGITPADVPPALFLTLLGLFAAAISMKHYERYASHLERARQYRNALDAMIPGQPIQALKEAADTIHNA